MDTKNVLLAVILSTIVLIFWSTFFEPPITDQQINENKISKNETSSSPSIDNKEIKNEIVRADSINKTNRIKIENRNIKGSISLRGAIIDDIIFKNYKESLNSEDDVIFLNPKNSKNEYFVGTGWAAGGNNKIKLPLESTIWEVKGNNVLTPNNPVTLEWNNNEGLIFTKKLTSMKNFYLKLLKE